MDANPMPCPFCGSNLEIAKHFSDEMWRGLHRCPVVGAIQFDWGDKDRITARWNRRQPPAVAVPEGWKLVPINPDEHQEMEGGRAHSAPYMAIESDLNAATSIYRAMVSAAPPAPQADPLAPIRQAIADYHYALDTRQHGGAAMDRALSTIAIMLGMTWFPGSEKARRDAQEGGK